MSTIISSAGSPPPAAAAALFERHEAGLRAYLSGLHGAQAERVQMVMQEIRREVAAQLEFEDDPTVWMFEQGRHRVLAASPRGDVLGSGDGDGSAEDEVQAGDDPAIAVHRAFERLTYKQQEVLRLKFQFGFNLAELARVTGVSVSGASGLLHSAVERTCRAAGATLSLGEDRRIDVRLTAYALDELEPGEKQAFAESVSDGKALLESSDAIRKVGAQLARIVASGAPVPRRRRKRKAAVWQSPGVLFGAAGMVAAGVLTWYFLAGGEETRKRREILPWTVNGDSTVSARTRRGDEREGFARTGGTGGAVDAADLGDPSGRSLRTGRADWEKKHFGHGQDGQGENTGADGTALEPEGGSVPAGSVGGARSPGAPTGETSKNDPAAEALGQYSATERGRPSDRESIENSDKTAPGPEATDSAADPARPAAATKPASPGGMQPLPPDAAEKDAQAPEVKEASHIAPRTLEPSVAQQRQRTAQGHWPKAAEARVAAMLRQMPLEKPTPENVADALATKVEIAASPWKPDRLLMRITMQARPVPPPTRPPASVVFAIDVSQSMAGPNRLPLVQEGIRLLAERLRPEDRVSVVTYAASAKEALPSSPLGDKALELRNCLTELQAAGLTNGDEGLRLAYAVARRARVAAGPNVVVLCTDGNFNLGETDEQVLATHAQQAAAEGIKLSVFGFGRSDRNDLRLELLATKGGGRSCYVNTREDAEQLLAAQIDGLLTPAANQVSLQVTFDSAQAGEVVRLDADAAAAAPLYVENLLPGRRLAALYEITPSAGQVATASFGDWETNFRRAGSAKPERMAARLDGKVEEWARTSAEFRSATAWAEFGRILKAGPAAASGDLDRLEDWVRHVLPDGTGGYRTDLLENIATARTAADEANR